MFRFACIAGAVLVATIPASLSAQEAPADPMATARSTAVDLVATARRAPPEAEAAPCKPKKKKFGLGGILKAASRSGLTNMVGGGLLGQGGALAGAAINTGVGVASANAARPKAEVEGC